MKETSKSISIIEQGLTIDGTLSCRGQLIVKGVVKGRLEAQSVIISEEGIVQADTRVAVISIGGIFEGVLHASERVTILAGGSCSGNVAYRDMVVEAGGKLSGDIRWTGDDAQSDGSVEDDSRSDHGREASGSKKRFLTAAKK